MKNLTSTICDYLISKYDRAYLTTGGQTVELDVVDFKIESTDVIPTRIKIDAFVETQPSSGTYRPRGLWCILDIKDVIFNDPATIVLWKDGTKTVVKCGENDTYSKEHGLAMCICKKALGNKGNYNNVFRKWLKEENE